MDLSIKHVEFAKTINFLDSAQVRYLTGGVTLDESTVTADPLTGLKKLSAGTLIGKLGNGKYAQYVPAVAAGLSTAMVGKDNDITFTAVAPGVTGNALKVQLLDPSGNDKALAVDIIGDTVVVSLATDAGGAITSTAADVIAAVNAHLVVKTLIKAAVAAGNDGSGVVTALVATALAGGTDANVIPGAILAVDVNFTSFTASGGLAHADFVAPAIDQGRVLTARLPVAPDDAAKAVLKGITFV